MLLLMGMSDMLKIGVLTFNPRLGSNGLSLQIILTVHFRRRLGFFVF
jgi:hypothetical protein